MHKKGRSADQISDVFISLQFHFFTGDGFSLGLFQFRLGFLRKFFLVRVCQASPVVVPALAPRLFGACVCEQGA